MRAVTAIVLVPAAQACTSIVVGKNANTWGAPMVTTTNDCVQCEPRVGYVPARSHADGSMRPVGNGEWRTYPRQLVSNYSSIYDEDIDKSQLSAFVLEQASPIAEIDQVSHTNALWDANYGMINEHGLALGESTCSGYLTSLSAKKGGKNLLSVRALMNLALERCSNARCGILTIGSLAEKYGFYSEDGASQGGAGEAVTLADPSGEAWVFHIMVGLNQTGAVWAAQRVPDDHVAVVANHFTIDKIDFMDTEHNNFYWSDNILHVARTAPELPKRFDGKDEDFSWKKYFAKSIFDTDTPLAPVPMYGTLRQWIVYRHTNQQLIDDTVPTPVSSLTEFPFSVPKDHTLFSLEDVMNLKREVYQGTDYDMTKGALAGPYGSPNRVEGTKDFGEHGQTARGISIQRTTYGLVHVASPNMANNVPSATTWFAADQPLTSVYVPFHAASLLAKSNHYSKEVYGSGSPLKFDFKHGQKAAWWAFDFVSNHMNHNFQNMSQQYVFPLRDHLQKALIVGEEELHERMVLLAGKGETAKAYQEAADFDTSSQEDVVSRWWDLAGMLVVRYNDGFFNYPDLEKPATANIGYPKLWQDMMGYSRDTIFPQYVSKIITKHTGWTDFDYDLFPKLKQFATNSNTWITTEIGTQLVQAVSSGASSSYVFANMVAVACLMGLAVFVDRRFFRKETPRVGQDSLIAYQAF